MRGEQPSSARATRARPGPTPHARGAVEESTPKRVGQGEQPRMRGEQSNMSPIRYDGTGPTPHARGAGNGPHRDGVLRGTNPACAGSRVGLLRRCVGRGDQPRMRGEQTTSSTGKPGNAGPTPHARGAGKPRRIDDVPLGTNPGCAGSRGHRAPRRRRPGDQPRMRGEQRTCSRCLTVWSGPTPHARGAGARLLLRGLVGGTNPACAGSSGPARGPDLLRGDQPRMRGEQSSSSGWMTTNVGPTPHARGAEDRRAAGTGPVGTNPACAGSRDLRGDAAALSLGPTPHARGAGRGG